MKLTNIVLAINELGLQPVFCNGLYRLGLISGYYRYRTPPIPYLDKTITAQNKEHAIDFVAKLLSIVEPDEVIRRKIIATADEITRGITQLYGVIPTTINFGHQPASTHWCDSELGKINIEIPDIKDIWEPARFSWVFTLGQAYHLTGDEKYPSFFWKQLESFLKMAPPNLGPHWMNGQELALRSIAFAFASQVFGKSPHSTSDRINALNSALIAHVYRIATTLIYAHSQRNNHLLSEAACLYTVGLLLQGYPDAPRWKKTGWNLFIEALRDQIAPDGSYIQHSTNYHRLMLHLAVWVDALSGLQNACAYPEDVKQKLIQATIWLDNLVLSDGGHVPNMGSNDGANILPLGSVDVFDYRPVIRLARSVFQSQAAIPTLVNMGQPEQVVIAKDGDQTACFRVVRYKGRPSHADQLHLDLWWRGHNIAFDAGTYRYSHPVPWDNALAGTACHNTVTIDDRDQMIRAGRFLWLKRANIHNLVIQCDPHGTIRSTSAEHDGYRTIGVTHKRTMNSKPDGKPGWLIQDELIPHARMKIDQSHSFRLAWLLPDWKWDLDQLAFRLYSPAGMIRIKFKVIGANENDAVVSVFRAGLALTPSKESHPTWGWHAPTYGVKEPALAVHVFTQAVLPLKFITLWRLPD